MAEKPAGMARGERRPGGHQYGANKPGERRRGPRATTWSVRAAACWLLALGLSGCGGQKAEKEPTVTVSIAPQEWFVRQIAGDSVRVNCLVPSTASPESYEPTASQLRQLASSKAYIAMGQLPFEERLIETARANSPTLPIAEASEGIELLYGTHGDCHADHGHGDEHHSHRGGADPHTWTSVKGARAIAANTFAALAEAFPSRRAEMETRYRRLDATLDSLDRAYASRLDSAGRPAFMVWHPSLSYLARDYGLEQIAVGMEGKESSAKGLRRAIDDARSHGAAVMLMQREFDPRQAESVLSSTGTRIATINPMNADWLEEMEAIVSALTGEE